ncbi:MAG: DUF5343 domain-containing protein [Burkholderiales bacterium]|nr:DUF5343 domain-containing protein [Burkholderiales bacterium]
MPAKTEKQILPAYISYSYFINFINGLRESGIPSQIDKSLMRTASGSQQSSMLVSLRFLRLIDENGKPSSLMKQLVEAADDARPAVLKLMLEEAYGFLFSAEDFSLENASGQQVIDAFKQQEATGSTISKAIAFFLSAANDAGVKVSPHVKAPPAPRNMPKRNNRPKPAQNGYEAEDDDEDDAANDDVQKFQIPIPGKPSAVFTIPKDLEDDDWEMLKTMLDAYIARMRKQQSL